MEEVKMTRRFAGFLLAVAAFMVFEWINLGFNLADGHPTAFYVVHGVLIAVNLVLAAVIGVAGWRAWRGHRPSGPHTSPPSRAETVNDRFAVDHAPVGAFSDSVAGTCEPLKAPGQG
ncbi:SCO4848 family membrane protein [Sphaerisporangium corydalis]|nr:hypothetical protein [Sphaerisporangium corydalis]